MVRFLSSSLVLGSSILLLAATLQSVDAYDRRYDYPIGRALNRDLRKRDDYSSDSPIGRALNRDLKERDDYVGFHDPQATGGSMLSISAGLGEPLNAILSAESDLRVLKINPDKGGFLGYMLSTQLSQECFNMHSGGSQQANLGDGKGFVDEIEVLRWNYGNQWYGTCLETFNGGNHLRYWRQNTTVSEELSLSKNHMIIQNGYNLGRDYLVGNLTGQTTLVPTLDLKDGSTFVGSTSWANYTYETSVRYTAGLLKNSTEGINHPE
ncbi:hypothetical protein QFC21_000175 [Naganishia friedmannii]|uniref:Uncharacterized protein n=1 Tax=Naganishia friedmannii TaxID=89922 RepID=A0ACC2WCI6_9TREE|nr:hypothetical protein QFC21_000175 [Naganishia friedmannii]